MMAGQAVEEGWLHRILRGAGWNEVVKAGISSVSCYRLSALYGRGVAVILPIIIVIISPYYSMKKCAFIRSIICASLYACGRYADAQKAKKAMSDDYYNIPSNCDFSLVFTGTLSNECTPKLKSMFSSPFTGILINAPEKIVWPNNADFSDYPVGPLVITEGPLRLMLAGLVRLKYNSYNLGSSFGGDVLVVAVDNKTGQTYSGKMPQPDMPMEPDPYPAGPDESNMMSKEDLNALISSGFNLDLVHDLGIPIAEASYSVYATLGEYRSNELIIETEVEKE